MIKLMARLGESNIIYNREETKELSYSPII
jgi:hypothetical protein